MTNFSQLYEQKNKLVDELKTLESSIISNLKVGIISDLDLNEHSYKVVGETIFVTTENYKVKIKVEYQKVSYLITRNSNFGDGKSIKAPFLFFKNLVWLPTETSYDEFYNQNLTEFLPKKSLV
jgi:hypothetical protein